MTWEQVSDVLTVVVPATVAYLAYRLSRKKDARAAQSGEDSNHLAARAQSFQGLRDFNEDLQEDNRELRLRLDVITKERDTFWLEVVRLRRKYGENGS